MTQTKKKSDFKEKERVFSVPTREGEELRFSVVEVGGKTCADIRYFAEGESGIWPTNRGIMIDPKKLNDVQEGFNKLSAKFQKK